MHDPELHALAEMAAHDRSLLSRWLDDAVDLADDEAERLSAPPAVSVPRPKKYAPRDRALIARAKMDPAVQAERERVRKRSFRERRRARTAYNREYQSRRRAAMRAGTWHGKAA